MRPRGLIVLALQLIITGCADHLADPNDEVLVGQFGTAAAPVELLATRAGAQLELSCDSYFATTEPLRLSADRSFHVRGRYYSGQLDTGTRGATFLGQLAAGSQSVSITLTIDGVPATVAPLVETLVGGTHSPFTQVCPS